MSWIPKADIFTVVLQQENRKERPVFFDVIPSRWQNNISLEHSLQEFVFRFLQLEPGVNNFFTQIESHNTLHWEFQSHLCTPNAWDESFQIAPGAFITNTQKPLPQRVVFSIKGQTIIAPDGTRLDASSLDLWWHRNIANNAPHQAQNLHAFASARQQTFNPQTHATPHITSMYLGALESLAEHATPEISQMPSQHLANVLTQILKALIPLMASCSKSGIQAHAHIDKFLQQHQVHHNIFSCWILRPDASYARTRLALGSKFAQLRAKASTQPLCYDAGKAAMRALIQRNDIAYLIHSPDSGHEKMQHIAALEALTQAGLIVLNADPSALKPRAQKRAAEYATTPC